MEAFRVVSTSGEETGSLELSESIFNIEPSTHAVHQAVTTYLAHQRQGNASTKTRAEVDRTGSKPRRQKGLGMARVGSLRSPLLVGGGVAFGPHPHRRQVKLPKKVGQLAVRSALTLRAKAGQIRLTEDLRLDEPKTKAVADMLSAVGVQGAKTLYLVGRPSLEVLKSCRNIPDLTIRSAKEVCTYDILDSDMVLITREGLKDIEERFAQ